MGSVYNSLATESVRNGPVEMDYGIGRKEWEGRAGKGKVGPHFVSIFEGKTTIQQMQSLVEVFYEVPI